MTLEKAVEFAEKQKATWEKYRGQAVSNMIWYVTIFNDGYCITDTTTIIRHPLLLKKAVYDTNVGFYKID